MSNMLIHNYTIPVKGIKKKIIYHFSDIHLTEYDDFSTEEEKKKAQVGTEDWKNGRLWFAKDNKESVDDELQLSSGEHLSNLISLSSQGDAFVMTGDICDYISGANLRKLDVELKKSTVPYIAVCGNHDKAEDIPDGYVYSALKEPVQTLDLGDIMIVGFDDSTGKISQYQLEQFKNLLNLNKHLIITLHIPIMTEENAERLIKCGEYFRLNNESATAEVYEFIDLIKQNSDKIVAVLAGHLHFKNNSEIMPGLMQYVSTQGLLGNINRYEIGE